MNHWTNQAVKESVLLPSVYFGLEFIAQSAPLALEVSPCSLLSCSCRVFLLPGIYTYIHDFITSATL